jgi:hypothetical protein
MLGVVRHPKNEARPMDRAPLTRLQRNIFKKRQKTMGVGGRFWRQLAN